MKEVKLFKNIGESSRGMYEHGLEHQRDLEELKIESHMLKHYFDQHAGEELSKMKFGGKIIKQTKSAFNRHICESVHIQENAKQHFILNSKSEYNRCALPRLTTKLGEITMDKLEKMQREKEDRTRNI